MHAAGRPIPIRVAGASDAPAIARLHAQSWRQAYRGMLSDDYLDRDLPAERAALWQARFEQPAPNQHVIVAEANAEIVGFACTYAGHDARWGSFLDNLHVATAHKRRGIGAALMQEAARWSAGRDPAAGMYLWVLASNEAAIRFYESMGGVRSGEGVWDPPDGGRYPKLRYAWQWLDVLLDAVAGGPAPRSG